MKTVRVRVFVRVDEEGNYWATPESSIRSSFKLKAPEKGYWIETELPFSGGDLGASVSYEIVATVTRA